MIKAAGHQHTSSTTAAAQWRLACRHTQSELRELLKTGCIMTPPPTTVLMVLVTQSAVGTSLYEMRDISNKVMSVPGKAFMYCCGVPAA
jgi:hypothetical protein